jgi:hypothetical protein
MSKNALNEKDESNPTASYIEIYIEIKLTPTGKPVGKIVLDASDGWKNYQTGVEIMDGISGLYFVYHGKKCIQIKEFEFLKSFSDFPSKNQK